VIQLILIPTLALGIFASGQLIAAEITVFAATSLTDALREISANYQHISGDHVRFNFAASNILAQQIIAGAPADIFFSADEAKMDVLAASDLIAKNTRIDLLKNSLVVITSEPGFKISVAADLTKSSVKHLALADPKAVPAGIYAKIWLEKSGIWPALQPKIISTENVRAAMAVVESGDAEIGIVYKTDAAISKKVWIALEIPTSTGPAITYPAALLKDSHTTSAAQKFLTYLTSHPADQTFTKFGFSVID
jgi:molybdate transport system substrate-binding protein